MKTKVAPDGRLYLWLDADDTEKWATKPRAMWPGSVLRGRSLYAEFEPNGDLVDYTVKERGGEIVEVDVPGDEFDAITTDHMPLGHPARRDNR